MVIFVLTVGLLLLVQLVFTVLMWFNLRKAKPPDLSHPEEVRGTRWEPYALTLSRGIDSIRNRPWEDVWLDSENGLKLHARLLPGNSGKTVLLAHGYRSSGENDFCGIFDYYHSRDFTILMIDQGINYQALKEHILVTTKAAYKVFLIWAGLLAALALLFFTGVLGRDEIFLVAVFFFVCDLICVLIWCPFRLIMRNKCCTTCRIFNWDHLMMFSPFVLTPGFYTTSLLIVAFAAWVVWEVCVMVYPERFWERTNVALQCANCTDKLCTQYCRKLRQ